jgi:type IV secretory pathway VirB9-like protein
MAKLTYGERKSMPKSEFVFPADKRYPIEDEAHARNALARSSGKPEEGRVRAAVHKKFPGIGKAHAIHKALKGM